MTDHNQFTGRTSSNFGRFRSFDFRQPVILGHGFERAQKIPPLDRDFPAIVIAKHIAAAENIDRRNPACETPESRAPVAAAGGEDDNVSFQRSKRGSAVAVTSQNLQNSNLYAH